MQSFVSFQLLITIILTAIEILIIVYEKKKILGVAGGTIVFGGLSYYLLSDKNNFKRGDINPEVKTGIPLKPDEREILLLASLAPSGHNAQPWRIKYIEPFHWIIENDKSRWLSAV
ncbi:MAG: hypothetical protein M3015_09095, partial [Bacteroidota bacterium]|nr:hypothetical protein [Bacteroidota bacterium]